MDEMQARLAMLRERARQVFGDIAHADEWFSHPQPLLGGRVPQELAQSPEGAEQVLTGLASLSLDRGKLV